MMYKRIAAILICGALLSLLGGVVAPEAQAHVTDRMKRNLCAGKEHVYHIQYNLLTSDKVHHMRRVHWTPRGAKVRVYWTFRFSWWDWRDVQIRYIVC